jgi:hypothetical protein
VPFRNDVVEVEPVDHGGEAQLSRELDGAIDVALGGDPGAREAEIGVLEVGIGLLQQLAEAIPVAGAHATSYRIADVADAHRAGQVELVVGEAVAIDLEDAPIELEGAVARVAERDVVARVVVEGEAEHTLGNHRHEREDRDVDQDQCRGRMPARPRRIVDRAHG